MSTVSPTEIAKSLMGNYMREKTGGERRRVSESVAPWQPEEVARIRDSSGASQDVPLNDEQIIEVCFHAMRSGEPVERFAQVVSGKKMTAGKTFWWLVKKLGMAVLKWLLGPVWDEVVAVVMDALNRVWRWLKILFAALLGLPAPQPRLI